MMTTRHDWFQRLFPAGVPTLWCPPLTHFSGSGAIDEDRIAAHLRFIAPWVKGLLVPGTTGEGWELSDAESIALVRLFARLAKANDMVLLLGILRPTADQMTEFAQVLLDELGLRPGSSTIVEAMTGNHVVGLAFCPPRGEGLSQSEIDASLRAALAIGMPSALYQLPQVTGNEVAPETAGALKRDFENLLFVKDSSGHDRLRLSDADLDGIFFVRGAEGDYFEWYRGERPQYDGFLLSTANSFPRQFAELLAPDVVPGRAEELSRAITAVVEESFDVVNTVAGDNMFTKANKAIDHFNAYGPVAPEVTGPRLHVGTILPRNVLTEVGRILSRHGLLPERGYLSDD